jgi:hypothetical protein
MFWVHNDAPTFNHLEKITNVVGYPGRTFLMVKTVYGSAATNYVAWLAFDITGPWW